jgi:hypothetical protein
MDEMLAKHHFALQVFGFSADGNGPHCGSLTAIGIIQQYLTAQPMVVFQAGKVPIQARYSD